MDYKYWVNKLTDEEFQEWEVEMLIYSINNDSNFLTRQFRSFFDFIGSSFDWSETKKGYNYWFEIYNRIND